MNLQKNYELKLVAREIGKGIEAIPRGPRPAVRAICGKTRACRALQAFWRCHIELYSSFWLEIALEVNIPIPTPVTQ